MKKLLSVLSVVLTLVMIIGIFSACGGDKKAEETAEPVTDAATDETAEVEDKADDADTGEAANLVIAARGGLHVDAINAVKDDFEAEHNCTIEILGLEADDLKQKIALDSQNAEGSYDLIMADDPWMPELTEADVFLNLTEYGLEDDDDFIPASLDLCKSPYATGDTYGLPFAGNVQLFFYNKELFAENDLEVPTDWESTLNAAKKIKENGAIGYVIRGQQGNPIVSDYLPVLWAYGGDVFDDDWNVTVDSQQGVDSLNLYIALLENGENYEKNDIVSSVSDGNAGMGLGWPSWFISGTDATADYAKIPNKATPSSPEEATGMIGHWVMGVPKNSMNQDLAVEFLEFITSSDTQKEMADHGGVPTRFSVYDDSTLSEKYPFYPVLKEATEDSVVRPRTPQWSEIETVYGAELSAAISGTKTVEEALADAKAGIENIMK